MRGSPTPSRSPAFDAALVATGFLVAELAAVALSAPNAFLTIWPPNGWLCAMLLRRSRGRWPILLLATFPVNVGFGMLYGQPTVVAATYWVANVAEVSLAAAWLHRLAPYGLTLRQPRQLLHLAAAIAVSAGAGAAIGSFATLVWQPNARFDASAFSWWASDVLGMLALAPVVLTWPRGQTTDPEPAVEREAVGVIGVAIALAAATVAPILVGRSDVHTPFPILAVLLLTWAALRGGTIATAWVLLMFDCVTLVRHLHGAGDLFAVGGLTTHNAAALQVMLSCLGVAFLSIAAAVARSHESVTSMRRREEARSAYLAEVTHELRNPLAAILNAVEIAQHVPPGTPDSVLAFGAIERGARRMMTIAEEVLLLSRDESRPDQVARDTCRLPVLWHQLQLDCEALPHPPAVSLQWHAAVPDVDVVLDRRRFEVILHNLVSNALKFTERGVVEVTCTVAADQLVVTVRDSGIGISASDTARVFDRFDRGSDPRAHARPGSGLGLHTVRRYARQMGGDAVVSSTSGAGTTVVVDLPVRSTGASSIVLH